MNQIVSMNASLVYYTRCLTVTTTPIPSFLQSFTMLAYTPSTSEGLKWLGLIVSDDPEKSTYTSKLPEAQCSNNHMSSTNQHCI